MIHAVQIEVTNLCNAKCIFCPRYLLKEHGVMSMEVFMSLIDELKRRFSNELREIVFSGFGEPFMDHGFIEKLKYAGDIWPNTRFVIYSNGSLILPQHLQALNEIGNVSLNISLNGPDYTTREALMQIDDWHKVMWQIGDCDIVNKISMVAHPIVKHATLQRFVDMFKEKAQLIQFQSWAGLMYPYHGNTVKKCTRLFDWKTFDWQGNQIKCCFDIDGLADCRQCTEGVSI
jgi:molybdenum cofactor biosynthesis enzyme MoaA